MNVRSTWKPAFSNARTDARFAMSGSATQLVVSARAKTTVDEPTKDLGAEALTGQLLLADEDVDAGRRVVADPNQLSVGRIVCDEVGLKHADRPSVEQHEVVVGRVCALDRREIVRHDVLVCVLSRPPATDVRTLDPVVERAQVVGYHRPEHELVAVQSHVSRIG
jgi:hypothetical protein